MSEKLDTIIKSFHTNNAENHSFVDVLVSMPSPVQKRTLGRLVIITQINSEIQTKNLVNIINENIRSNYYSNINANIEFSLETTLSDFNKKIKEIEKVEKIKDLKSKISSCVIVVKDDSIYFTQYGEISSLLIHKSKIIDIAEENIKNIDETKIFSDIVIGKITKNTALLFSTDTLFDYTEKEKISNHLENSNVNNTTEFIKKSLDAKDDISSSIGFVLIGENKNSEESVYEDDDTSISSEDRNNIEQNIIPKLSENLNKPLGFFKDAINFVSKSFKSLSDNKQLNDFINQTKKNSKEAISKISEGSRENIKKGGENISNSIKVLAKSIPDITSKAIEKAKKIQEISKKETFPEIVEKYKNTIIDWYKKLSLAKKIVSLSMLFIIIVSFVGFRIWQQNEASKALENQYQDSIKTIKSIQNEAITSLIYSDTIKAKGLIDNAEYLISNLKIDSKSRQEIKDKLETQNKSILDKVYKITKIINPTVFVDLSTYSNKDNLLESISANKIVSLNNTLYAVDYTNKSFYSLNQNSVSKIATTQTFGQITALNNSTSEDGKIVFSDSDKKLYVFDGQNVSNIELKEKYQTELAKYTISDINSYGSTIYLLDKEKQDVVTIKKGTTDYSNVYSWMKSSWDLKDSSSITIDGYMYIAKSNGVIEKFLKGYNRAFSLNEINPKLDNIAKIYTDENTDNIYILDANNKRFLAFNKNTGALIGQYLSDSFDKLKDFYIDFKTNKAYILNDNKVFEISL